MSEPFALIDTFTLSSNTIRIGLNHTGSVVSAEVGDSAQRRAFVVIGDGIVAA
jgi:hypothetical protein